MGLLFITTLPCYLYGFGCDAAVGSGPWMLAVAIGVLPSAVSLATGRMLLEEWPLTPFSLFMFNGEDATRCVCLVRCEAARTRPPSPPPAAMLRGACIAETLNSH